MYGCAIVWYQKCPRAEFEYLLAEDFSRWIWFSPTSTSPAVLLVRLILPWPPSEPGLAAVEPDFDRTDEKTVFLQHHYPTWLLDHCLSHVSSSWIFLWCPDAMLNISEAPSWLFSGEHLLCILGHIFKNIVVSILLLPSVHNIYLIVYFQAARNRNLNRQ